MLCECMRFFMYFNFLQFRSQRENASKCDNKRDVVNVRLLLAKKARS